VKPHVVGVIFARGGSKGAPRKNIRLLAGRPLIAHAIEAAQASKFIDRVIVSTDDAEIADVAKRFGAEVPFMRPAELAQDNSAEWAAWQHAIRTLQAAPDARQIDVFVSIPPTSPLRTLEDVDRCISKLLETDADIVITVKPAERSPWFNMVVLNPEDNAELVIKPDGAIHHRQSAPEVFDVTTVAYAARPDFVLRANSLFEGKVKTVMVPAERSLDIDTNFDFELAEMLLRQSS
jgi:N-acylneuraminate cytidylyltransferase